MKTRVLKAAAFNVIQSVDRLASNPPDPETSVRNAARATTILGRVLQTIADRNFEQASPIARRITQIGLLSYGLIELSVPRSFQELLFIYWIKLLFLVGVIITAVGVFRDQAAVWHLGVIVLLLVWAADCLRSCLGRFMQTGRFPLRPLSGYIVLLLFVVVLSFPQSLIHLLQSLEKDLRWIDWLRHWRPRWMHRV